MSEATLLEVENLSVHFPIRQGVLRRRSGVVRAVDGVSFAVGHEETLSLVGESGCGKSTTALALMGLVPATAGHVRFAGEELLARDGAALRRSRRRMQIVFQDPFSSLNPRQRVRDIVAAPLEIHRVGSRRERRAQVFELLERVGLRADQAASYPHELSGGQRQRIGIARALALQPKVIICDEPVSALDVSVQAQILNLLSDIQRELGVAYLVISHDLGVVEHVSTRVAVMYLGKLVETATRERLFEQPLHPYTELLLRSAPVLDPRARRTLSPAHDELPGATNKPTGCAFHTRCPLATAECRETEPPLSARADGRQIACHHR